MSSRDEPISRKLPTCGDLFEDKARDRQIGHLGRSPELRARANDTPQVCSVVPVPGRAKAESDESPRIQALRGTLKEKYGSTFVS